jgi:hypothetical protein
VIIRVKYTDTYPTKREGKGGKHIRETKKKGKEKGKKSTKRKSERNRDGLGMLTQPFCKSDPGV